MKNAKLIIIMLGFAFGAKLAHAAQHEDITGKILSCKSANSTYGQESFTAAFFVAPNGYLTAQIYSQNRYSFVNYDIQGDTLTLEGDNYHFEKKYDISDYSKISREFDDCVNAGYGDGTSCEKKVEEGIIN